MTAYPWLDKDFENLKKQHDSEMHKYEDISNKLALFSIDSQEYEKLLRKQAAQINQISEVTKKLRARYEATDRLLSHIYMVFGIVALLGLLTPILAAATRYHIHIGSDVHMDFYAATSVVIPAVLIALYVGESSMNKLKSAAYVLFSLFIVVVPCILGEASSLVALSNNRSNPLVFSLTTIALGILGVVLLLNTLVRIWQHESTIETPSLQR